MELNIREFLDEEYSKSVSKLKNAVIEYLRDWNDEDDIITRMNDILDYGALMHGFMTYNNEFDNFYESYESDLLELIDNEYGSLNSFLALIIEGDDLYSLTDLKIKIVCFGIEETVRQLLDDFNL